MLGCDKNSDFPLGRPHYLGGVETHYHLLGLEIQSPVIVSDIMGIELFSLPIHPSPMLCQEIGELIIA